MHLDIFCTILFPLWSQSTWHLNQSDAAKSGGGQKGRDSFCAMYKNPFMEGEGGEIFPLLFSALIVSYQNVIQCTNLHKKFSTALLIAVF